jgi:transcriptional regulator with XRE-family HTH domain
MGKGKRARPALLGKKLQEIRRRLALSQNGMLRYLDLSDEFTREELSAYERGVREPPLHVLLRYSKAVHIWVNVLIDDSLELPDKIPSTQIHGGAVRNTASRREGKP